MIFTSFTFIIFFIILIVVLLISQNNTYRLYVLLTFSYIFYGWWNIYYLALIFIVSFSGWLFGKFIYNEPRKQIKKFYLSANLLISLGILSYYKYTNFFIGSINKLLEKPPVVLDILLPVGISFFTFQTLSYTIDIYREKVPICRSLAKFSLFVAFFPQLVAGPIVRASDFLPQLYHDIKFKTENCLIGAQIFLGGALQKVLIADNLSQFVDIVYQQPQIYSSLTLWLTIFAYSMQIFCDFSGYSLMAIGISRILGFSLPKNFNMPYNARSITEFWHRWHISLSLWLRDYVYISMGGNRKGVFRTQVNMFITMLLGGLWHGASWNFVIWGALHGMALGVNRFWTLFLSAKLKNIIGFKVYALCTWLITVLFVTLLWIPFRSPETETSYQIISRLFLVGDGIDWFHIQTIIILGIAVVWHIMHWANTSLLCNFPVNYDKLNRSKSVLIIIIMLYLLLLFFPINNSPFIYFQF